MSKAELEKLDKLFTKHMGKGLTEDEKAEILSQETGTWYKNLIKDLEAIGA